MDKYAHLAPLFLLASAVPDGPPPTRNRWFYPDVAALLTATVGQAFPDLVGTDRYQVVDELVEALAAHLNGTVRLRSRNCRDRINLWLAGVTVDDVRDELFKVSELLDGRVDR